MFFFRRCRLPERTAFLKTRRLITFLFCLRHHRSVARPFGECCPRARLLHVAHGGERRPLPGLRERTRRLPGERACVDLFFFLVYGVGIYRITLAKVGY